MTIKPLMMNSLLHSLYYDPELGFGSVDKLYRLAQKRDASITRKDVRHWLRSQLTYTLHHPARRHFIRNRIIASSPLEMAQADLVDMQMFKTHNDGYRYLLTVVDVFSKMAHVIPVKTKNAQDIRNAFALLFKSFKPFTIQTDRGLEFNNRTLKDFMNKNGTKLYFTQNQEVKAAVVERFNRTLKSKMFKYFTARGTRRYVDVLEKLVDGYNMSYHRSIRMRPVDVPNADPKEVFFNLYGADDERELLLRDSIDSPKFAIGDCVRVQYHVEPMDKSYYPLFTDKVYRVSKIVKHGQKLMYQLKNERGHLNPRKFYAEELQLVAEDTPYRIEKILAKRRRQGVTEVLVKWLNYDDSYNQWIKESDLQDVAGS